MACQPTATETQFQTNTVTSTLTTFSLSPSVLPGGSTTVLSTICPTGAVTGSAVSLQCTTVTNTESVAGGTTDVQVPYTTIVISTAVVPTTTLFATCPKGQTTPSTTPTTPAFTPTTSTYTPPPTTYTTQSFLTAADGSVSVIIQTLTSTLTPSAVVISTTPPQSSQGGGNSTPKTNLGPIIGGVVGGFLGLIGIVGLIWFILRRRNSWDDIFEKDYEDATTEPPIKPSRGSRLDIEPDSEPKPYQYGLVGHMSPPAPTSPPGSPPLSASLPLHGRNRSSVAPLMLPTHGSTSGPTTMSSRPSTAGSMYVGQGQPVRQADHMGMRPTSSRSHASQSSQGSNSHSRGQSIGMADQFISGGGGGGGEFGQGGSGSGVEESRRQLQVANPSDQGGPSRTAIAKGHHARQSTVGSVVVHQDGGRIDASESSRGAPPGYDE